MERPGHNAVVSEGETDYLVYHAYEVTNRGRSALQIRKLVWGEDGWPTAGKLVIGEIWGDDEGRPKKTKIYRLIGKIDVGIYWSSRISIGGR